MKLVQQISLWFSEGNSDKIYEVDLCEVGGGKFVVNFRYGRRGAALKDGSKTPLPINEQEAKKIYDKLVNSKKKEGYQEVGGLVSDASQTIDFGALQSTPSVTAEEEHTLENFVWQSLQNSIQNNVPTLAQNQKPAVKWSLSRIIWRVGELRIKKAVPTLISLLPKSDAMQQYCICWALGRCGDAVATPTLQQLAKAAASKDMVKRIANLALLEILKNIKSNDLKTVENQYFTSLPKNIQTLLSNSEKINELENVMHNVGNKLPNILHTFYLLLPSYPHLKETIKKFLATMPFKGEGYFKSVRYIYKAAEFRDDFEILSFIAVLFEVKKAIFSTNQYYFYIGNKYFTVKEEVKKKDSKLGYSENTRSYLIRRTWRTLRTLAESNNSLQYVDFAKHYLVQFTEDLYTEASAYRNEMRHWAHNPRTGRWETSTIIRENQYKEWAEYQVFNQILYRNSPRFENTNSGKAWKLKQGVTFETPAPNTREEAYPEFWDAHPEALIWLLKYSQSLPVHQFAVKALKHNELALSKITYEDLKLILTKPYPETLALGIELAKKWYDPQQPNLELAMTLFHAELLEARELARNWVEISPNFYTQQFDFYLVIISKFEDNRNWMVKFLKNKNISEEITQRTINEVTHYWLHLTPTEGVENYINEVSSTFGAVFEKALKNVHLGLVSELLKSPINGLQIFGAQILLKHNTLPENLPDGMIGSLVNSALAEVRQIGVSLFGKLPNNILLKNRETLKGFCLAHFPEIRASVRPVIARLAAENPTFGREWADEMMPFFKMKEPFEGLHEDLLTLFTTALAAHWQHLDNETALRLLGSSKMPRQVFGQFLLANVVKTNDLAMRQILKLADHDLIAVRRWVINFYETNIGRIKYEASEALRILDAKWEEVRLWSFDYFRRIFSEREWTPELLVFVCDSTRNDVQQFGKEMITKFFKEENGVDYLLKLSQHPSQNLQNFATHYLEQFASGKIEYIEKLEHYFITILSQVNRSSVAKMRIFNFLEQEALQNEVVAQLAANIMTRQSATIAVADKAASLRVMAAIKRKFPNVKMAMQVKAVAVR